MAAKSPRNEPGLSPPGTSPASSKPTAAPGAADVAAVMGADTPSPSAPPVEQHLVITQDDLERSLARGEVIAVGDADAELLISAEIARPATTEEVELARPRIRVWTA